MEYKYYSMAIAKSSGNSLLFIPGLLNLSVNKEAPQLVANNEGWNYSHDWKNTTLSHYRNDSDTQYVSCSGSHKASTIQSSHSKINYTK